jgi:hypothetical protein
VSHVPVLLQKRRLTPFFAAAASQADPVNGWRWVFRTMLLFDGILLLGFGFFYHVR